MYSESKNPFQFQKDHDTIRVRNLQESIEWYAKVFQLKEIPTGGLPDHIKWVELGNKVQIHLVESSEKIPTQKGVHYAWNTTDFDGLMEYLLDHQVAFENLEGEKGTTNTRPDGIRQIYLQDPNGYWIEINDNQWS